MTIGMGVRVLGQAGVFLMVARRLGVEIYGAYAAVLALAMTVGSFTGFGVSVIMLQDTARAQLNFDDSWRRTLGAWLLTSPLGLLIYGLLGYFVLPQGIGIIEIWCIGVAEIIGSPLLLYGLHAYQGHERLTRGVHLLIIPIIARLIAAMFFFLMAIKIESAKRLSFWSFLYLTATIAGAAYGMGIIKRDLKASLKPKWGKLADSVRQGWPFAVGGAAYKAYVDIDKVMLARLSTLDIAGAYSAAYRVLDMAEIPLASFFSAAIPRFFRAGESGVGHCARYAMSILPLPLTCALTLSVFLFSFTGILPWLLGPAFGPGGQVLRVLAWLPILTTCRQILFTVLATSGRQHHSVGVLIFGTIINVLVNFWAIPFYGWRGAAGATYAAEIIMVGLLFINIYLARDPKSSPL